MDQFDKAFPNWSDQPEMSVKDKRFITFIFGGNERIETLRAGFQKMSKNADLYISTHGCCGDVREALGTCNLLSYFQAIQARDGVWTRKDNLTRSNREMKLIRAWPKLEWIEQIIEKNGYAVAASWFIDDTKRNYNAGYGKGVLPTSRGRINVLPNDAHFAHNGIGISRDHLELISASVEKALLREKHGSSHEGKRVARASGDSFESPPPIPVSCASRASSAMSTTSEDGLAKLSPPFLSKHSSGSLLANLVASSPELLKALSREGGSSS